MECEECPKECFTVKECDEEMTMLCRDCVSRYRSRLSKRGFLRIVELERELAISCQELDIYKHNRSEDVAKAAESRGRIDELRTVRTLLPMGWDVLERTVIERLAELEGK